jgi:hypothetical protein
MANDRIADREPVIAHKEDPSCQISSKPFGVSSSQLPYAIGISGERCSTVYHLELEQEYFNAKRWFLNRLVIGSGVVCGLDVKVTPDRQKVIVQPGVAIDRCGREIIVTESSHQGPLPELPAYEAGTSTPAHQVGHG